MTIHFFIYIRTFATLVDAMTCFARLVDSDNVIQLEIIRSNILEDFFQEMRQKTFHPRKFLGVWFIGESGSDTGGLTRQVFTLFSRQLKNLCERQNNLKIPKHDATKLQVWRVK